MRCLVQLLFFEPPMYGEFAFAIFVMAPWYAMFQCNLTVQSNLTTIVTELNTQVIQDPCNSKSRYDESATPIDAHDT